MSSSNRFLRLTALWAFVESGLGAVLHAFQLPFTGIILGGFSVIIIGLLALYTKPVFKNIIQATLMVLAIKFAANPATSPMAFIAVAFQGLMGAIIFSTLNFNIVSTILLGTIAMLESALQKLLVVTLLFGNSFWTGLNKFFESVCKTLHIKSSSSIATNAVWAYVFIFLIWGILLGIWLNFIPKQLNARKHLYSNIPTFSNNNSIHHPKKKFSLTVITLLALFMFSLVFNFKNNSTQAFYMLLRTTILVLIWLTVLQPLWKKLLKKNQLTQSSIFLDINTFIPLIKNAASNIYKEVSKTHRGIQKWKEFVLALIVYSLNLKNE